MTRAMRIVAGVSFLPEWPTEFVDLFEKAVASTGETDGPGLFKLARALAELQVSDEHDPIVATGEVHAWRGLSPPSPDADVNLLEAWRRWRAWSQRLANERPWSERRRSASPGIPPTPDGLVRFWRQYMGWLGFWSVRGPTEEMRRLSAEEIQAWRVKLEEIETAQRKRGLRVIEGGDRC